MSNKGSVIKMEGLDKLPGFYSSVQEVARAVKAAKADKKTAPRQQSIPQDALQSAAQAGQTA